MNAQRFLFLSQFLSERGHRNKAVWIATRSRVAAVMRVRWRAQTLQIAAEDIAPFAEGHPVAALGVEPGRQTST